MKVVSTAFTLALWASSIGQATEFFVAPQRNSKRLTAAKAAPGDLATALAHPNVIREPGDNDSAARRQLSWRLYQRTEGGLADHPITNRQMIGERVIFDLKPRDVHD